MGGQVQRPMETSPACLLITFNVERVSFALSSNSERNFQRSKASEVISVIGKQDDVILKKT